jgi:glycerol uptake facilitator-like aquaporin
MKADAPKPAETATAKAALDELVATAFLLMAIAGSGVMAERLSGGNMAVALLANSTATGCALAALILTFGPRSGAHMNPAVTIAAAWAGELRWRTAWVYAAAQAAGAILGVWLTHAMFELPILQVGQQPRAGLGQWIAETVATAGLLGVVWGARVHREPAAAFAVGAYIAGAYWFTASTSFANPAVTIARGLTDTFTGIHPLDAPAFIGAQALGAVIACAYWRWR